MFRMLKLNPPHGWSAVLWELAIVTLGVLVALAAQQGVEAWSWTRKVVDAERQLTRESRANYFYAAEMVTVYPCVDAQLDRLRRRVLASGAALTPAPLLSDGAGPFVLRQPSRPYITDAWQSLKDDGSAPHIDEWRQNMFAARYSQIANLQELSIQSNLSSGRLMLLGEAIPLDPGTRSHLLEQISEQRRRAALQSLVTVQVMSSIRDLGQAPSAQALDRYLGGESGTVKYCRAHQLPLADWRKLLAAEEPQTPVDDSV